ncbi:MAG TPA: imidazoleglycerol-phosphate dehydratase HisB [Ktedonobacterales bacterium]
MPTTPAGDPRRAERRRQTRETTVTVALDLDRLPADGEDAAIATSVPFLDHLLGGFARHGRFTLRVSASGDTRIDDHHTVEDVGITLGQALLAALGERRGIVRFGTAYAPMDEALARAVCDISGRPYLVYELGSVALPARVGAFDTQLVEEFWRGFATEARLALHLDLLRGRNAHHCLEALFKAAGLALHAATRPHPGDAGIPSTKGVLG